MFEKKHSLATKRNHLNQRFKVRYWYLKEIKKVATWLLSSSKKTKKKKTKKKKKNKTKPKNNNT